MTIMKKYLEFSLRELFVTKTYQKKLFVIFETLVSYLSQFPNGQRTCVF
jgi:hypothetical protein